MSTSGSFTPPAVPECSYAARMTRAAALALRTAGTLNENCHVVITDGPSIGTAGNQSVTEIELHPTSPTAFSLEAKVKTTFDDTAWEALFDIDLGAAGSIIQLADNQGNVVKDIAANSPTVHGQFPWHLIGIYTNMKITSSTLTGWATAVGGMNDTEIRSSTVNLTGKTGGAINSSLIVDSTFISGSTSVTATALKMESSANFTNAGFGAVNLSGTALTDSARIQIDAGNVRSVTLTNDEIDGGYVLHVGTFTTGAITVTASRLHGPHNTADEMFIRGSGSYFIQGLDHVGNVSASVDLDFDGSGSLTWFGTKITGTRFVLPSTNIRGSFITNCDFTGGTITHNQAGGASTGISFTNASFYNPAFNIQGAGLFQVSQTRFAGTTINTVSTSTPSLSATGGQFGTATITVNRTSGAQGLQLFDCQVFGVSTINDNGATDPGGNGLTVNRAYMVDSVLTFTGNVTTGVALVQQLNLTGSTLTVNNQPAAASNNRIKLFGATLTLAGFVANNVIIDGNFTKTLTATNNNRLCSKAYDDII